MSKSSPKVARRYAKALIQAYSVDKLDGVREALNQIAEIWQESIELKAALLNPGIPQPIRESLAIDIATRFKPNDEYFINLFRVLSANNRMSILPNLSSVFSELVDSLKKALSLEITTAFELDTTERIGIEQRIARDYGTAAKISWATDRSLIGGMIVKTGDKLLDSSIRGTLEQVRNELFS